MPLGMALLVGTLAAAPLARQSLAQASARPAVEALLRGFDAAWAAQDVDALMQPVSPTIGCELYGKVDYPRLRATYSTMMKDLPGSTCSTDILRIVDDGDIHQAFVCRLILAAGGQPVEELCHIFYVRSEPEGLSIVGLEEYDHQGLACIQGDSYRSDVGLFSLRVPDGTFVVPWPRNGIFIDRVLLRGMGLQSETEILLLQTTKPFDLELALDTDLRAWEQEQTRAKVELRTDAEIAGFPAMRARSRYSGLACALSGRGQKQVDRKEIRVYVQLDSRFLLAIYMRCPRKAFDDCEAEFDRLLGSIRIEVPFGLTFGAAISERHGWGKLADNRFARPDAGFLLEAPPEFEIEASEDGSHFRLRAYRLPETGSTRTGAPILIDGVQLIDPGLTTEDMIAVDDDQYRRLAATERLEIRTHRLTVCGQRAVRVDRHPVEPASDKFQSVIYLRGPSHLFTVQVVGTLDEVKRTSKDLDSILKTIRISEQ